MELDQQVAADRFNEVHRGHLPKPVRAFCEAAETPVSLDTTRRGGGILRRVERPFYAVRARAGVMIRHFGKLGFLRLIGSGYLK
jgi:hypothetical protein